MTNKILKSSLAFLLLAVLTLLPVGRVAAADNAYFSLTGSGSYAKGSKITTSVKINAGDPAISFQANLHYDASKLECVSVDDSGTSFPQSYDLTCGGGSVSIAATTRNKAVVTAPTTVAHISFVALTGSGSTSVTFTGTGIYNGTDGHNMMVAGSNSGATFTFTTPVTSNPSNGGSTSTGSTSGGSSSSNSSSTKSTTATPTKTATTATPTTGSTSNSSSAASDSSDATSTTAPEVKGDSTT